LTNTLITVTLSRRLLQQYFIQTDFLSPRQSTYWTVFTCGASPHTAWSAQLLLLIVAHRSEWANEQRCGRARTIKS